MITIDQYAYINKWKAIHPIEKFCLAIFTLMISLLNTSWLLHAIVITFMSFLIVFKARIPAKTYAGFMMLPMLFLIMGVAGIAIDITKDANLLMIGFPIGEWMVGISKQGFKEAAVVFTRAYAAVTCLYLLALTTPMVDIISLLKRLKIPGILIELMILIYRFIFVLMETGAMIYVSQDCRLGYSSYYKSYHSLGQLISNLFIKAFHRSNELYLALSARGYTGELKVLEEDFAISKTNIGFILFWLFFLLILTYML
ncbi:MAG: cobalt ECF transporter T component CbiQ [Bacillota bacterium]